MRPKAFTRPRVQLLLLLLVVGVIGLRFKSLIRLNNSSSQPGTKVVLRRSDSTSVVGRRQRIKAFIGVQTGFTEPNAQRKYNYELRREQLRKAWFPASRDELLRLEKEAGIVARFIVGHSHKAQQEKRMQQEIRKHGDFLQLDITEKYLGLAKKTLIFFSTITALYDADYIIKIDDDVFLRLDRMPHVLTQWKDFGAGYIGCMKTGEIMKNPKMRWYEPQHALLGSKSYFAHTWGSFYVLSGSIATFLSSIPAEALRYFSNEDVTVGSWMLAFNVSHYDDRRMCEITCSPTSIAVYDFPKFPPVISLSGSGTETYSTLSR